MNRRNFLGTAAAAGTLGLAGCASSATGPLPMATPDVGRKFFADGRVHPFPGSSIIFHVEQQGPNAGYFNALLDIYREAPRYAFARKLTMLPPSSYHMTLFDLVTDAGRTEDRWPDGLALDASIADCNRYLADRLRAFQLGTPPRFAMRVAPYVPGEREPTLAVRLEPANEAERARIRDLRDRLSTHVGIRARNHDSYGFHTTLGYFLQWLTPGELVELRSTVDNWQSRVAGAAAEIVFGAPEFCTFADMFAFNRQFFLN